MPHVFTPNEVDSTVLVRCAVRSLADELDWRPAGFDSASQ